MSSCREPGCQWPLASLTPAQHYNIYHRRTIFVTDVWIVRSIKDGLFHCAREGCESASKDAEEIKGHYGVCGGARREIGAGGERRVSVVGTVGSERIREGEENAGTRWVGEKEPSLVEGGSRSTTTLVKPSNRPWSPAEDSLLHRVVSVAGPNPDWSAIEIVVGRTRCQFRWENRHKVKSKLEAQYLPEIRPESAESSVLQVPSKHARDELGLTGYDDSDDEVQSRTKHPRVYHGRWSESQTGLLLQLVAAAGGSEPDWASIERQVGRIGCKNLWKKIQDRNERAESVGPCTDPPRLRPRDELVTLSQTKRDSTSEPEQRTDGEEGSNVVKALYTPWTATQTATLTKLVTEAKGQKTARDWWDIEQQVGRKGCRSRWRVIHTAQSNPANDAEGVKRHRHRQCWTNEEDVELLRFPASGQRSVEIDWTTAGKRMGRTARACQDRWELLKRQEEEAGHSSSGSSSSPSSDLTPYLPHGPAPSLSKKILPPNYDVGPSTSTWTPFIDQERAQRPLDRIGTSVRAVDPATAARSAAIVEMERDAESMLARAVSLEQHTARMRRARADADEADRRIAAALKATRDLDNEYLPSLGVPSKEDRRGVSDFVVASTPKDDKPAPLTPTSLPKTSNASRGLIYLGSDSSSDKSE